MTAADALPKPDPEKDSPAGGSAIPTLALCVVTYLRPIGLARLLDAIGAMDPPPGGVDLTVVVVDNDASGSAAAVVEAARATIGLPVVSVVEPQRGITYARNRALAVAAELGVEWIGWLDDDEAPHQDWLQQLFEVQQASEADVVTGPSRPIYEPDAAAWIVATGAFERDHFPTGAPYPFFHTRTSGVIHRASVVPEAGFDDRLALTGGEDRVFFTRMHRAGATFVWADEAVVDEWVPTSRVDVGWLRRRWFRIGVTRSLTLLYLDNPGLARRSRRFVGGLAMALQGLARTILALRHGRTAALRASRLLLIGLGSSWGALGRHLHEYQRIHGR